jgi:hypothetical protein
MLISTLCFFVISSVYAVFIELHVVNNDVFANNLRMNKLLKRAK